MVPKLRFPEFRDAAGWRPYILEELEGLGWVKLGRGEVISNQDIKAIPGDYPIYSSSVKNNGLMGSYGRFMFDEELISWSVDGGGDFFYRPPHKFSVTNVSGYMRLNTSHLNYRFTASQLQALHASLTFDYQFKAHPSVIRKLYRLAIPSPAEQQKIAECLSSVDELIAAQARKLTALKTHKKGLMQQLFPREGETQPRLRFPEFQNTGEWGKRQLSQLTTKISDGIHATPVYDETGEYTFINGNNLANGKILINEKTKRVNLAEFDRHKNPLDANSILMSINGTIGNLAIFRDEKVILGKSACFINVDRKLVNKFFIYYLLQTDNVKSFFDTELTGSTIKNLSLGTIKNIQLLISTLPEQQRIADCLTSLDDLIAAETQKLDALKTHKKGLMQQLFPSPDTKQRH